MKTILALPEKKSQNKVVTQLSSFHSISTTSRKWKFHFPSIFYCPKWLNFFPDSPGKGTRLGRICRGGIFLPPSRWEGESSVYLLIMPRSESIGDFRGLRSHKPSCLVSQNRKPFGWLIGKLVVVLVISNCEACWIGILWLIWGIHWQTMPKAV